jgi:transcriptional regulator with XRE-family HTH domain
MNETQEHDATYEMEVLEEMGLALAQSTMQRAMNLANLNQSQVAGKLDWDRSFVSKIMRGDHNLTVKTFTRVLAACGFEPRFDFALTRIPRWASTKAD